MSCMQIENCIGSTWLPALTETRQVDTSFKITLKNCFVILKKNLRLSFKKDLCNGLLISKYSSGFMSNTLMML